MRLRRLAITFAATAAVIGVLVVMAASDQTARAGVPYQPDLGFNISANDGNSIDPAGAASREGNNIFVWVDTSPGSPTIFESHATGGTLDLSPPQGISSGDSASKPDVAAAGSTFVSVWLAGTDVIARASTNAGQSWLPAVHLGPIAGNAQPQVQIDPANPLNVYVVWNDSDGAGGNVYAARSFTGGQAWTPPKIVGQTFVGILPSLAVTSDGVGHISVVTQPAIDIFQWTVAGAQPTIDVSFPYGARNAFLYSAEGVDVGGIQLMFDTRAVPTSVLTAHKSAAGWLGPTGLSDQGPARNPSFAIAGSKAVAVWEEGTLAASTIKAALSNDSGATFSAGIPVTQPDGSAFDPDVLVSQHFAFILFKQESNGPTPTPPGTAEPKQKVAITGVAGDSLAEFYDVPEHDDPDVDDVGANVLFALEMFFHGGLIWGRSMSEGAPAAHPAIALVSTRTDEDTLTKDVFLHFASFAGDADCSGNVDLGDAVGVLNFLSEARNVGCLQAANVDCGEGALNTADLLILLKYLGGLPYNVPADCMPINLDEPPG